MPLKNLIRKEFFLAILTALLIFFAPHTSGEDLGAIRSGEVRSSSIDPVADTDSFNFYGNAGETVIITPSLIGGMYSAWLELYDPDGVKETDNFR